MKQHEQIDRTGQISFTDAGISIGEEGPGPRSTWKEREAWELIFKRHVFARVVQTLNRLGWKCSVPDRSTKQNSHTLARSYRDCSKGHLKGELHISGRSIDFKMWQGLNTPTRSDHGGRYESNLEACMPYVLRLEMERTRRRIRDYLLGVFSSYTFKAKLSRVYPKPLEFTAMERVQQRYEESWHFKGDWAARMAKDPISDYNRKSKDGALLEHGQRVWYEDRKGRICEGTALYNINSMWWVVSGRYEWNNKSCSDLMTAPPADIRIKRNVRQRRARLESLLSAATRAMNFERAAFLRDLLFPKEEALYVVYHQAHGAYHCSNFAGYTKDLILAGRFTGQEVKGWGQSPNKVMPLVEKVTA